MKEQKAKLKKVIEEEKNQKLLQFYSIDLTPLYEIADDRMDGIDRKKLMALQQQFSAPFNLRFIIEEQNLYPPK